MKKLFATSKNYVYAGLAIVTLALLIAFFNRSQRKNVAYYSQKFCGCAAELSDLEAQRGMGRVSESHYKSAKADFELCLGKDDPFKSKTDSVQFLDELVRDIRDRCPDIARNMGFKIE